MLLECFLVVLLLVIYHYSQENWKFYVASFSLPGPYSVPYIGTVWFLFKNRHDLISNLLETLDDYGPRMPLWLGPYFCLLTSDPNDAKIILNHKDCLNKLRVDFLEESVSAPVGAQGMAFSKVQQWKKNRKILTPCMTNDHIDKYVGLVSKRSDRLVRELKNCRKNCSDVMATFSKYSYEVICDVCFGSHTSRVLEKFDVMSTAVILAEVMQKRSITPWIFSDFFYYKTKGGQLYLKIKQTLENAALELLRRAKDVEESKRTIYVKLSTEGFASGNFSSEEIRDEAVTMLLAGTDAVTQSLGFTCTLLGMHPEVVEKAYKEIMAVVGPNREITHRDLYHLRYVEMIVKESLRLSPPFPGMTRQTGSDIVLTDNLTLPAKSKVVIFWYHLQRNAKYWKNPLAFEPERFSATDLDPHVFLALSAGPRNCFGYKFAMKELTLTVANLVRNFKFSTKFKSVNEIPIKMGVFLSVDGGFDFSLIPRVDVKSDINIHNLCLKYT